MSNNPLNPDQANVVVPQPAADTASPSYPLAMYHPTKGMQFVVDAAAQAALVASDAQWATTDPFATT